MNVKYIDTDNFEADDILGTVAKLAQADNFEVNILPETEIIYSLLMKIFLFI